MKNLCTLQQFRRALQENIDTNIDKHHRRVDMVLVFIEDEELLIAAWIRRIDRYAKSLNFRGK